MKYCILLVMLSFNSAVTGHAQSMAVTEKETIQKTINGFFEAIAALDTGNARSFCSAGITILENGSIWNYDSLAVRITAKKAKQADYKRINKLVFLETRIAGKTAWTAYLNQATVASNNNTVIVKWIESAVLEKQNGRWKISLLHSTELERRPLN